jgi:nucleotide-binding universal stress UspA family protein
LFSAADTEFLVISVMRLPKMLAGTTGYGMVAPLTLDPASLEAGQETEADLSARAEAAGITDPEAHTESGDPVDVICRAAEEHDVDVIVVGSHDKSALRRLFEPSVAVGVARATYRPVLIISGQPPS